MASAPRVAVAHAKRRAARLHPWSVTADETAQQALHLARQVAGQRVERACQHMQLQSCVRERRRDIADLCGSTLDRAVLFHETVRLMRICDAVDPDRVARYRVSDGQIFAQWPACAQ